MKVKVISLFQDKYTKQLYNPGSVIEIADEDRVEDLTIRNLVEVVEEKKVEEKKPLILFEKELEKKALVEALKVAGVQATGTMGEKTLLDKVAGLDEEAIAKLKEALGIE